MEVNTKLMTALICWLHITNGANILGLFNLPTPSHHYWTSVLLAALAERGHNITVLSTIAQKKPVANLTDIVITGIYDLLAADDNFKPEEMSEMSAFRNMYQLGEWLKGFCRYTIENEGMKTLLNYPDNFKFDLIIYEPIGTECLLGVAQKFGSPPLIGLSGLNHPQWINDMIGNPYDSAYINNIFIPYSDHMTFLQRLNNVLLNTYVWYLWTMDIIPTYDAIARDHLGPSYPTPSELIRNTSIMMVNTHPTLDYPRPLLPSVINVGGIQIKEPQLLSKDVEGFLDGAAEGAIYFSLGTNLRSDKLKEDTREAFLAAFAELPQRILWKFESDSLPGQPKNVMVKKWLSQSDILAHPNVRLFITHSGLLSTQEAVHRGVPVVGIPFFMDQQTDIHKMIDHGAGVKLEYKDITKESVLNAIRTVLGNPSYAKNMQEMSTRFRDRPEHPLQLAVYWCEYVIRHKGARHLRSAALDLTWYQYLLLDVIAFLMGCILIPVILLYYCCKRAFSDKHLHVKIKKH